MTAQGTPHEEVVRRCADVLRREPRNTRALLGMGAALHALGRLAEAKAAFTRAVELAPGSLAAWTNLAATLSDLGEADLALDAAQHAVGLDHAVAPAQLNLGDALRLKGRLNEATQAYREATRLQPDSPIALNKLGCALQVAGDLASADELLSRAVLLAPAFWLARLNLVTVKLSRGSREQARALLAEARSVRGLDPGARGEARVGLRVLEEQERLEPAIRAALDRGEPGPIEAALASAPPDVLTADEGFLAFAEELVRNTAPEAAQCEARFPALESAPGFFPLIEAHFSSHRPDSVEAARGSLALTTGAPGEIASLPAEDQDLLRYLRAGDEARRLGRPRDEGVAWEAWIRFLHARLSVHRTEVLPGHFKAMPNIVVTNPWVRRLAPQHVAGTLRRFFAQIRPKARPGPMRAALVYFVVAQAHAFVDGNGRVGRFLCGRELEAAGFCPAVAADSLRGSVGPALAQLRSEVSLRPLMDHFASGARIAVEIARRLGAEGAGAPGA